MHGAGRDAERYRDEWQDYAERFHALLLAPEFSAAQFPGRRGYNLGNVASKDGPVRVPKDNAFAVIERIFDDASKRAGLATRRYRIYGHSAGAQFVHRMVLFQPQARIEIAVAANAGWYTMPDFAVDFPYGLKGAAVTPENLRLAFAKKLVIALGDNDTHFDDRSLNRSAAAMQQGAQRLERGGNFFRRAERSAAKLKTPFRWRLVTVPGAGHQNSAMAAALAPLILE